MKRQELIRELEKAGCVLHRHGSRHDSYRNPGNKRKRRCRGIVKYEMAYAG
jgi:hypothetical protein